jgi:alkylation response protein AidB-like acyl-CoA dehydrogenase
MDGGEALAAATAALAPRVRELADETERGRRLPTELARSFAQAGIFRMLVPASYGGLELPPATMIRVIEALSAADGSAGWCAMIGATSALTAAYLEPAAAREIYGADPLAVSGGVFAPHGRAISIEGGYTVSGRSPFASGCEHCDWLMIGSLVLEGGRPRLAANGLPESRLMLFPRDAATIHDTWNVAGLRGTGSHDIEVRNLFVPASRSVSIVTDRPREQGPLYRFPVFGLLALGGAAVSLGIGRAAIDELRKLALDKVPTAGRRRLSERGVIQVELAEAVAMLRAARAFLFETVETAWRTASRGDDISLEERAALRLAATHAVATAASVADRMYTAGGGTAIYAASPLQRALRDAHVVTQHMMVAPATLELVGRVLFGIETDTSML